MNYILKSSSQNSRIFQPILFLQKSLIALLALIWVPLSFINFDPTHDGLILATVRLIKASLLHHGEYPLNQYGPFWAMPFVLLSLILPKSLVFLGLRSLTILFYLLSAIVLWKISRLFLNQKLSNLVIIIFLGSQPFVSDHYSDLVPWPSAVVMPFVLVIAYFTIKQIQEPIRNINKSSSPFYIGFLLPAVLLTRIQVGLIILIPVFVSVYFSKAARQYLKFLAGFLGSSFLVLLFLFHFKWIREAFYDQIILGSKYMTADIGFFPKPIFTLIGVFFFCLVLLVGPKIADKVVKNDARTLLISGLLATASIFCLGFYLSTSRSISLLDSLVTVSRRFWITFCLATLLITSFRLMISAKKSFRSVDLSSRFPMDFFVLFLFALGFQSQMFPLFDQMHFWWGSPLTFLIVVLTCRDLFGKSYSYFLHKRSLVLMSTTLLLLSVLLPWTAQISSKKESMPIEIGFGIYSSPENVRIQRELQEFFHRNIPRGAKVLNLCDRGNVFFEDNRYSPASRIFVFWGELMSQAPEIYNSIRNSRPSEIIVCRETSSSRFDVVQIERQKSILKAMMPNPTPPVKYFGEPQTVWEIYHILNKM